MNRKQRNKNRANAFQLKANVIMIRERNHVCEFCSQPDPWSKHWITTDLPTLEHLVSGKPNGYFTCDPSKGESHEMQTLQRGDLLE